MFDNSNKKVKKRNIKENDNDLISDTLVWQRGLYINGKNWNKLKVCPEVFGWIFTLLSSYCLVVALLKVLNEIQTCKAHRTMPDIKQIPDLLTKKKVGLKSVLPITPFVH